MQMEHEKCSEMTFCSNAQIKPIGEVGIFDANPYQTEAEVDAKAT